MTTVETRDPAGPALEAPVEPFPRRAPPGFFADREWGWRSGTCAAGAHVFDVACEHGEAAVLEQVTGPLRTHTDEGVAVHYRIVRRDHDHLPVALYRDLTRLAVAPRVSRLLRFLTWQVNRSMVATTSRTHVVLHAACAVRAGITVLLPGDREQGKTTTVAGLLREGYDYVTDEAAAIDLVTLRLSPFPKALSIDPGAWSLFPECRPPSHDDDVPQWQVPAHRLGSLAADRPVPPPRLVIFPRFTAGAATRRTRLTPGEALRMLSQCAFDFPLAPRRNLEVLARVATAATAVVLEMGDLDSAVTAVEQEISHIMTEELTR